MKNVIVFDLDGTIADIEHRRKYIATKPKNWKAFCEGIKNDTVKREVQLVYNMFVSTGEYDIIFASGRSDEYRDMTEEWLHKHDFHHYVKLYMRKEGDYRADYIIKKEILDEMRADGYNPILTFDDRDQVVQMWRENGIPCFQVAEGSF